MLEQYKTFANLNVELTNKIEPLKLASASTPTDEQLIQTNDDLKVKLTSRQEAYESLLAKMETLGKHNDELTKNVAKLEAIGKTTTEAPRKTSILTCLKNMPLLLAMV